EGAAVQSGGGDHVGDQADGELGAPGADVGDLGRDLGRDLARGHHTTPPGTSAIWTSTPASRIAATTPMSALESVTSTSIRSSGTVWHIVSWPSFVWSARTTRCCAAAARARSTAATSGLGVLRPRSAVRPLP